MATVKKGGKSALKQTWDNVYQNSRRKEDAPVNVIVEIISQLGLMKNAEAVLEIGTGRAGNSICFARKGHRTYGVDISLHGFRLARSIIAEDGLPFRFIQADAHYLPFRDNSFDIIFHQGFLEHFSDPEPLIREQYRILNPNGYLIIQVPQRYNIYTIVKHLLIILNIWPSGWETEYSCGKLNAIIRENRFEVIALYGTGSFWRLALKAAGIGKGRLHEKKYFIEAGKKTITCNYILLNTSLSLGIIGKK